jgi:hypothetical protein
MGGHMDVSTLRNESHSSGVSWGAVVAGAFVAAALSLALLALGTGIGLSSVSPWANAGASAIGWKAIGWLVLMQVIASSVGGYLAGRLRTKWVDIHTHEVYFRDTAHGFLAWSVGLVITAAFLTSAAASVLGGAGRAIATPGAAADASMGQSRDEGRPNGYLVDRLLRTNTPRADQDSAPARAEIGLIFVNDIRTGSLPPADETYVAQVVAARTGASQADAERQVADAYAEAQQIADTARKAAAHAMYWTFLALLVGAFCAAVAATIGGDQRDHVMVA